MKITQKRLKELMKYDEKNGIFIRTITRGKEPKGKIAGTYDLHGYRTITIDRKSHKEHRLAWLYIYGYLPENDIDHINGVRDDNRICNLREVARSCNLRNKKNISSKNKSGVTGVYRHSNGHAWCAAIWNNNKIFYLGSYKKFKDAVQARWEAEKKFNYPNCTNTSSAYIYLQKSLAV